MKCSINLLYVFKVTFEGLLDMSGIKAQHYWTYLMQFGITIDNADWEKCVKVAISLSTL